jgi:hypothetical protein
MERLLRPWVQEESGRAGRTGGKIRGCVHTAPTPGIWRDEAAVDAFRNWEVHRGVQANSRKDVFLDYRLRVVAVLRDYGMTDREHAPRDSREAHS